MTIRPSTLTDALKPAEPVELQRVEVTGKKEPDIDVRELMKQIIEQGPELIKQMTPDELEVYRQTMHDMMIGGGTAKTLVEMAEMMSEGGKLVKEELAAPDAPDKDADVSDGIPVTNGQMPQFVDLMKLMMCRVADKRLTDETASDQFRVDQTQNSPEGRDAQRDLKEDKQLRKRLDVACTPN